MWIPLLIVLMVSIGALPQLASVRPHGQVQIDKPPVIADARTAPSRRPQVFASSDARWPAPSITFRRLGSADGLPHNTIHTVLQDRQGFLWIGTADGLARYDGYEFVVYRRQPGDTASLSHNTVRSLYEDDEGALWIGTERGVDRLDRQSGRIRSYGSIKADRGAVWDFAEDSEGKLWIGSPTELVVLEADTRTTHRISAPTNDSVMDAFGNLAVDPDGTIWVGHWNTPAEGSVFRLRPDNREPLERVISDPRLAPGCHLHAGPSGTLWVGSDQGVFRVEPATKVLEEVSGLPPSNVLHEDSAGRLWAAGPSGLYLYDPATKESLRLALEPTGTNALSRNVRVIFEDRSGIIWIGTLAGLYRHVPGTPSFVVLRQEPGTATGLSSNVVSAILEEPDAVWIGTLGGGLNRLDRSTGEIRRFQIQNNSARTHRGRERADSGTYTGWIEQAERSRPDGNVWAIHRDTRGILWIGTDAGLCRLEVRSGTCRQVDLGRDRLYVNAISEDEAGSMWIGGNGLFRMDPAMGLVDSIALLEMHFADSPRVVHNVQALHFDDEGVLWIGTEFSGLLRYHPDSGRQHHYVYSDDGERSLRGRSVRSILTDPEQPNLRWLGTEMGLVALDVTKGTFRTVWPRRADESGSAYAMLPDEAGRLWVSTSRGILRLGRQRSSILVYDESAGTGSTEFNRRAGFRGDDGTLYFGGMRGLTAFKPEDVRDDAATPPVVITDISVANRDSMRQIRPYGLDQIVLGPNDNTLSLEFAALSFVDVGNTTYAYRLDGFDERWVPSGRRRSVTYTNLPAGRYTFRVRASIASSLPAETAALSLLVRPPLTQTWWFRMLIVAVLAGTLLGAHRFRVAHLLRVERMRTRIAGDLHDEIGSKLSSIALRTEMVARESALSDKQRRQLEEITQTSRRMVNELRDIVWMVNPQFDSFEDLVSKIDHTASSMLGSRTYDLHVADIVRSKPIPPDVRRHLYLMCREILHNVVRHSGATHVEIRVNGTESGLEIAVADDGLGFDPEKKYPGNGLQMLRTRAATIDSTLEVWSRPEEGTRITVHVEMA